MSEIKKTITVKDSIANVYKLVSTPEGMTQWFCTTCDATDKGFTVGWTMPDGQSFSYDAVIVEDKPDEKFSYRTVEDKPTTTTFELATVADGTQMTVTECCFEDNEEGKAIHAEHDGGWEFFLKNIQNLSA